MRCWPRSDRTRRWDDDHVERRTIHTTATWRPRKRGPSFQIARETLRVLPASLHDDSGISLLLRALSGSTVPARSQTITALQG